MTPIKYIGRRQNHRDNLYGTKAVFQPGSVISVPDEIAKKMLRHGDVYALVDAQKVPDDIPVVEAIKEEPENQDTDALLQSIDQMDKSALSDFANAHFRMTLDKRKGITELREMVKTEVLRFGVGG